MPRCHYYTVFVLCLIVPTPGRASNILQGAEAMHNSALPLKLFHGLSQR